MNTEDRLLKTMAAVLGVGVDALPETASPATISNWDSVNHLNLVMALESEFGISIAPEDVVEMRDVASIRRIARTRGAQV